MMFVEKGKIRFFWGCFIYQVHSFALTLCTTPTTLPHYIFMEKIAFLQKVSCHASHQCYFLGGRANSLGEQPLAAMREAEGGDTFLSPPTP